jgi:hypothetical protein
MKNLNLNTKEIYEFEPKMELYNRNAGSDFPLSLYISNIYGKAPIHFYSDDLFSFEIFDFLLKNSKLVNFSCNGKLKNLLKSSYDFRGGSFTFFYKDIFVKIIRKNQDDSDSHFWDDNLNTDKKNQNIPDSKKVFNLSFYGPAGSVFPIKDFEKFIYIPDNTQIHLFIKNSYGEYTFEPLAVKIPKELNLELNYGKQFLEVSNTIEKRLFENSTGLYMFHGPSGTGKSTFIKYLSSKIKKDFIYVPTAMLETFTTDPSCLQMLLQKSNSIIVLEDAEKLIMKRHGDSLDTSSVSSLLNLCDGILSDILNIAVIITYNCDTKEIDPALKRKGRLMVEYKFDILSQKDAVILAKHLNYPDSLILENITNDISLAEIYNLNNKVKFYKEKEKQKMGF